jgi:DNA end-binding protein Ku
VQLAGHILASKETRFDPRKFKDEYEAALKKLVARKAKGQTIEATEPEKPTDNVINLMDALKQSLGRRTSRAPRKRKAPRKRTRSRKAA